MNDGWINRTLTKDGDSITGIEREDVPSTGKHAYGVTSVVISNSGDFGVCCTQDSKIRIFDMNNEMTILGDINAGNLEAWTACMSLNNDVISAGSHTGAINFYSVEKKEYLGVKLETGNKMIMSTAFSPDGSKIASVNYDGYLYIHDITSAQLLVSASHSFLSFLLIFSFFPVLSQIGIFSPWRISTKYRHIFYPREK